jgi:hypothetical protein
MGCQRLGGAQRCPWAGTQSAAFGEGCRTGLEFGAHANSARRSLERAHDGPRNRAEQVERATTLVGP